MLQAEELVRYFYRVFHGVDSARPVYPAVGQAVTLIAQHGIEKAKYVVDFASRAAPETKYAPQTFGGILHYASRAIADFERQKLEKERSEQEHREQEEQRTQQEARVQAVQEANAKAQAYLDQLTPEDRQQLHDQLVAEMRSEHPFLADYNGEGLRAMVSRAMLIRAREILADTNTNLNGGKAD
jgi:Na+-transporting methylmalonyl-CoA/oxaloacetate decarboxylase gamma subunit